MVQPADDGVAVEATTTVDQRKFGMGSGLLGMIRRPATLHVKALLKGDADGLHFRTETSARQRRLIFGALLLVLFIASLDRRSCRPRCRLSSATSAVSSTSRGS